MNRYLAALSHVFTVAMKDWAWLDDSPMRRVRKLKEPRGRVRYLTDEERHRFLQVCRTSPEPYLYPIVLLAISTGMRRGEIMRLRWRDLDWDRKRAVLHETKNGERRSVPIVGLAHEVLQEMRNDAANPAALLFGSTSPGCEASPKDIGRAWDAAVRDARLDDFRFHDLRHTAASYLAMNGASANEIAEVLGHKSLQMVKRYAHLCDSHTTAVVERMNERFLRPETQS